jgi:hypothetical protein
LIKNCRNPVEFQKKVISKECILTEIKETPPHYTFGHEQFSELRPTSNPLDTIMQNFLFVKDLDYNLCSGYKRTEYLFAWKFTELTQRASVWINYIITEDFTCKLPEVTTYKGYSIEISFAVNEAYQNFQNELILTTKFINSKNTDSGIAQIFHYFDPVSKKTCEIECIKRMKKEGGDVSIYWL